ncbi:MULTISPECIES: N-acetylneuraminate synthase family protein [Eubacteriales]|uniref:Acetylneuraminic acid synthetase n=1 Tax=Bittarella massiliensis (ex Durand et al. 2017) TaxID=1720313 RepID=A0AAQ1MD69_9FIRM|nr:MULTISPECIES: N-acetylneuraminate synthase family protein [Eubacteriales]ERJ01131.1 SAF domain protein [Clostridium sp. ATCC 29733]MZL68894.1 acetylneuraminic acid synthetase [Bittarella massiliensis (ex Durand et al. 2017)]MZL80086.1 acetylneuraminic acid synthetase [Bittarella massiliensis (ex Durand et al. 2017)]SHG09398.1 N-acetylneuraminate synthase [Bittarella massiliensis (ex Durand et al. 2017)]
MSSNIINRAQKGQFSLIAEIGVNYYDIAEKLNLSLMDAAKLMVAEAKNAGIHAVKFQSYKADTLASKHSPAYWDLDEEKTKSQYELFKKFDSFGYEEYKELSHFCGQIGIEFLSTAFDIESADYLFGLMNVYKVSSSDLNNKPFLAYQAKKNKPILLSTGASNLEEIIEAVETIRRYNSQPLTLLHCVLQYPTPFADANLNKILSLKKEFPDIIIGYSDHTKPTPDMDVCKTAYNLGAVIIEKHFTLDKSLIGNDHYHGMDPSDAKHLLEGIDFIEQIKGSGELHCLNSEKVARANARRSLVSLCRIPKGTIITEDLLTYKRPGTGISPDKIQSVLGKVASLDIEEDTVINYSMFGNLEN